MPLLGFGVYKNYTTTASVTEALKAGYRYVREERVHCWLLTALIRHIDTAQAYRNEGHVGLALKESGLKREDVFISDYVVLRYCAKRCSTHWQLQRLSASITVTRRLYGLSSRRWRVSGEVRGHDDSDATNQCLSSRLA